MILVTWLERSNFFLKTAIKLHFSSLVKHILFLIKGDYLRLPDIVCAGASFEAIQHSRPLQSIRPE